MHPGDGRAQVWLHRDTEPTQGPQKTTRPPWLLDLCLVLLLVLSWRQHGPQTTSWPQAAAQTQAAFMRKPRHFQKGLKL